MSDDLGNKNRERWTKIMFGVLAFFGVATLILGILRINQTISFTGLGGNQGSGEEIDFAAGLDNTERSLEELQLSDTDGDGLTDFDELYVYSTSMYLADSDSDGYSDKSEIDGGYDPNCPKGSDCRGATTTGGGEATTGGGGDVSGIGEEESGLSDEAIQELENLTADEVRQLLLASGEISQEELDQIDDETLMEVFREMLNQ